MAVGECEDFFIYSKNLSTLFACACVNLVEMVLISPVAIFLSNTDADPVFSSCVVTDVELMVSFFLPEAPTIPPTIVPSPGAKAVPKAAPVSVLVFCLFAWFFL